MKKILLPLLVISFLLSGVAFAEIRGAAYNGNNLIDTGELKVYVDAYNNSDSDIASTSHSIVVLDTSAITTSGQASSCVGTFFTSTTTAGDSLVLGITEGAIPADTVGRVIVRGPSKVDLGATSLSTTYAAGATISTSSSAFLANTCATVDAASAGVLIGTLLGPSGDKYPDNFTVSGTAGMDEVWNSVWWAWIGKM